MNVEKMRHQLERASKADEALTWSRTLARMTPEHRAKHTGPFGQMACTQCFATAFSRPSIRR